MIFEEKEIRLKDGRTCILRSVRREDAADMIEYLRTVSRGNLRRVRHRCGFAIALKQEYCDAGLGTAMMEYALSLAREMGYEQVELEVVDGNDRARHVYEKMGFRESGRVLRSLKYDDGSYRDEISMVKLFD